MTGKPTDTFYGHGAPLIELTPAAFEPKDGPRESGFRLRNIDGVMVRCDPETGDPL